MDANTCVSLYIYKYFFNGPFVRYDDQMCVACEIRHADHQKMTNFKYSSTASCQGSDVL